MDTRSIWLPALAMVALTFLVWLRMFFARVGQMRRERIHPQKVATSAQAAALLTDSRAADNFRNLFELPVLFYLALVVAERIGRVDGVTLALAWAFVSARVAHSLVHVTYNRVMHRFATYVAGGLLLVLLWVYVAAGLVAR
ncbi:MAPEG family protein [Lysobacter humi (ex Lee et al. 2017)]